MAKHESESTYISMDNTRISEKTFSVPFGFGGYILTIDMCIVHPKAHFFFLLFMLCIYILLPICMESKQNVNIGE